MSDPVGCAPVPFDPVPLVAAELGLPPAGVAAVAKLLGEGATVPFIARYRKELTGGLDEVQIRAVEERRAYQEELHKRRTTILASLAEQGKLTDELQGRIRACTTKTELEDLYLPFKPKRRTRATIARERGLQPLADRILAQPRAGDPRQEAAAFVDPARGVGDPDAALAGARDIVAEACAEHAGARRLVRERYLRLGSLRAEVVPDKQNEPTKFETYYDFQEGVATIPSHRFLAIQRGEAEGVLRSRLELDLAPLRPALQEQLGLDSRSPFAGELETALDDGLKRLLLPSVETDVRLALKEQADRDAVEVFADNLRHLLLAAPLGERPVLGVDPGIRTGCKCAALDATGRFLATVTIFPGQGGGATERARRDVLALVQEHRPFAIAVGNGTGGRETEAFLRRTLTEAGLRETLVVAVNESGASVYSASDLAREEHPDLDLTIRGAISIGRRLQDPLAELVKIDPQAIGVGQYQHDVHQPLLGRKLAEVVESCVNRGGGEGNTASAPLLGHVAGIGPALAKKIVRHREEHGPFRSRAALRQVTGLGPRTFEQAAGFLRVRHGEHPLDASAVHPERYGLVERMARDLGVGTKDLVGDEELARRIELGRYVDGEVGLPTLRDILAELAKPGRDPRDQFTPPRFREDVQTLEDVQPGMELEGIVTNVTAFGAFVDVGVHQDGLVHVSELADRFVRDPREVVKTGDRLQVRVLEVDRVRRRLSLPARQEGGRRGRAPAGADAGPGTAPRDRPGDGRQGRDRQGDGRQGRDRPGAGRGPRGPARPDQGQPGFGYNPFADLQQRLGRK